MRAACSPRVLFTDKCRPVSAATTQLSNCFLNLVRFVNEIPFRVSDAFITHSTTEFEISSWNTTTRRALILCSRLPRTLLRCLLDKRLKHQISVSLPHLNHGIYISSFCPHDRRISPRNYPLLPRHLSGSSRVLSRQKHSILHYDISILVTFHRTWALDLRVL